MEDALPQDFGRINLLQWSVSVIKKKGAGRWPQHPA
jgi:hypothetical protein